MTRESPALEVDRSLSGQRVVAVLDRLASTHGLPKTLFVDNGPEFTSKALDEWAHRRGVKLAFSRPGTPTDNPFIEAFNARFREECLNQHWLISIEEARTTIEAWRAEYILSARTRRCATKRRLSTKRSGSGPKRSKRRVIHVSGGPNFGCGPYTRCLTFYLVRNLGSRSGSRIHQYSRTWSSPCWSN